MTCLEPVLEPNEQNATFFIEGMLYTEKFVS